MNKIMNTFAKGTIYFLGLAVVVICAVLLPELAREEAVGKVNPPAAYPYLIGAWILALPIFMALYQTHRIIEYIYHNQAFSPLTVRALRAIKNCTIVFSCLLIMSGVTVILTTRAVDPTEDVTAVVTLTIIGTCVTSIVTTFVAVLQKLLKEAIMIKSEHELLV